MQVIKEKILLNNQENYLKINIFNKSKEFGIDKEISDLLIDEETNAINQSIDYEKRRFKYIDTTFCLVYFHFGSDSINLSNVSWVDAGFTDDDINYQNSTYKNSFIILDIFDTFDFKTQRKLSTNYITKLGKHPNFNLGMNVTDVFSPTYSDIQLSNIFIPEYFLNDIVYCKFSFFNAKTGKIVSFINNNNESIITSEKMYGKIKIDRINNKWEFLNLNNNTIVFKELLNNVDYTTKIENTLDKKNDIKQQYPSNENTKYITFDYKTGEYF